MNDDSTHPQQVTPARPASRQSAPESTGGTSRRTRTAAAKPAGLMILVAAIVIPVALAVAAYAVLRSNPIGMPSAQQAPRHKLDLQPQATVADELLGYTQRASLPVGLSRPQSLAVGRDDAIYVAGDRQIQVLEPDGTERRRIELEIVPTCLAVAGDDAEEPGRLYVGSAQGVLIYGPDGTAQGSWPSVGEDALLTAIALTSQEVFVADAGNRLVLRYDLEGQLLGRIGAGSEDRSMPGFVIPSPYFDLVVGPDMFLYVVNSGARRVECYTFDGQLQGFWGSASSGLEGFFGCCNPAHLARTVDGRFVTSEKGIPRVKIYDELGDFETVVAGPAELDIEPAALGDARAGQSERVFDVAVNRQGEVLVLDPRKRSVRVFTPKNENDPDPDAGNS